MKKQILKQTKNILIIGLLVVSLMTIKLQPNVAAIPPPTTSSSTGAIAVNYPGESFCFDSLTYQTYQCGPNTHCITGSTCATTLCNSSCTPGEINNDNGSIMSNRISSNYVVEPPGYNTLASVVVSGTTYYKFKSNECYVFGNPPDGKYSSTDAWVGGLCDNTNSNLTTVSDPNSNSVLSIITAYAAKKTRPTETIPDQQLPGNSNSGVTCVNNVNQAQNSQGQNCSLIAEFINPAITFLSALVGIVVTASIIIGGIQYSAAGDNPQAVASARKRIFNAVLALLIYGLLYGFLNFIIPGGI